jgi:coenzyme F420-reducing hydrogenase delta subunit/ferredoxin
MGQRLTTYGEVELGYSAEQAVLEAGRCLVCGPCSECLACVRACKPGAVVHEQHETLAELEIGAILYAAEPALLADWPSLDRVELTRVAPGDPLAGSAAAARVMFELFAEREAGLAPVAAPALDGPARIGVFVCQCGGYISDVVDTEVLRDRAVAWPDVVHAEVLPFACSSQAAETMRQAAQAYNLNRAVLAACSCCSIDQVCTSCTFQRVRCKDNLGILPQASRPAAPSGRWAGSEQQGRSLTGLAPQGQDRSQPVAWEFVNIREQCAWAHSGDPRAATAKATALTAAAVAKVRTMAARPARSASHSAAHSAALRDYALRDCALRDSMEAQPAERSVLVLGSGAAARVSLQALLRQGIPARHVAGLPTRVQRANRRYAVARDGASWEAAALVLAPTAGEVEPLLAAFGADGQRPRARTDGPETHRPGVFVCDPALDPGATGAAAAARAAAWLGRAGGRAAIITAVVDAARCRACGTCVDICEFGAPEVRLRGDEQQRTSWIDPAMCAGCGTCAAHCPSGAITAGYSTAAQLEAILDCFAAAAARNDRRYSQVVIFTCNWNAYSGLETAGSQHLDYSAGTRPIKVMCLGHLDPGTLLKAFEKGADGVLLLGCPPGECHYEFGNRRAEEVFAQAWSMASLLGIGQERLKLDWVGAGQGQTFVEKVQAFCEALAQPPRGGTY